MKCKIRKIVALMALLLPIAVTMSGCRTYDNFKDAFFTKASDEKEVSIGVIEPLSGNNETMGKLELQGIEIAHQLRPKVNGKSVRLMVVDNQSSVYAAEAAAKDLVARNAIGVIGSYGDAVTLAAAGIFKEAKIPAIACSTSNPLIISKNHYYFSLNSGDYWDGQASAMFFEEGLNLKKAALIWDEDPSKKEIIEGFSRYFKEKNGNESIVNINIDKTTDYRQLVESLVEQKITGVFAPISTEYGRKLIEASSLYLKDLLLKESQITNSVTTVGAVESEGDINKIKTSINDVKSLVYLGDWMWNSPEMEDISKTYSKINVVVPGDYNVKDSSATVDTSVNNDKEEQQLKEANEKLRKKFNKEYEKKYQIEPTIESARAFDAYNLLLDALENSKGKGNEALVKSILLTRKNTGLTGPIKFSAKGEAIKPVKFYFIKDGEYKPAFVITGEVPNQEKN